MDSTSLTQTKYATDLLSDQRASDVSPDIGSQQVAVGYN